MNPSDWVSSAEHIFKRAAGYGLVLLIISGLLYFSFSIDFIETSAMNGVPYAVTRMVMVASAGLLAVGLVTSVFTGIAAIAKRIRKNMREIAKEEAELKRLLQNFGMISDSSQLILYRFMKNPGGRFLSPGDNTATRELVRSNLILPENSDYFDPTAPNNHMCVNPLLLLPETFKYVEEEVEKVFPNASKSEEQWRRHYDRIDHHFKGHRGWI